MFRLLQLTLQPAGCSVAAPPLALRKGEAFPQSGAAEPPTQLAEAADLDGSKFC